MKLPVSIIVLTYNEEGNIGDCLKSVYESFDEIFIVDSYSNDTTFDIAKKYTDKIYRHPFENYAQQSNWAQTSLPIKNEWVFHLDADERASQELISHMERIPFANVETNGFLIARKTIFRGTWIKHGGHYPVYHLRLFKKNKGRCEERLYDQHYEVEGNIGRIKGDIINVITPDLKVWRMRHEKWAAMEAQEILGNKDKIFDANKNSTPIETRKWLKYKIYYPLPLFIRPFIYFLWRYIFMLGFLDGKNGLIFHFWQGLWYRWLVDVKIKELSACGVKEAQHR